MRYLLILIFLLCSCSVLKKTTSVYDELNKHSLKEMMNQSIIEGFYDGDLSKGYFKLEKDVQILQIKKE